MSRIGFIGTGHIAAPMARALARSGHSVTVSERNADVVAQLVAADLGIKVATNQGVVDASDTVFLCLRPTVWAGPASELTFRSDQQIVSVIAGVSLSEIAEVCAPVTAISATIPLGFIETGGCPLPVMGDPGVVSALFGGSNPVIKLPDGAVMHNHSAASTLISAVLGVMQAGSEWLGDVTGDANAAEVYVSNLMAGFLGALDKDQAGELATEKWALAAPGTLNLKMVEGLDAAGAFEATKETLERIRVELEQKT